MRRKIFFLIGLVGFIILIVGVVKFIGSAPKQGVLKVNSVPSASIFLDNKHIGRTPFEDKVAAGDYTIKIVPDASSESLASWQGKITVSPSALTYVNRDLSESELSSAGEILWLEKISSNKSELSLTTIPDGATILVDDENKGITPVAISSVTPADHTIAITSSGFAPRSVKIKTPAGYKLNALIQLALFTGTANAPTASASAVLANPTPAVAGATTGTSSMKGDITIQVLNGGGVIGAGSKMKKFLEEKGYKVSEVSNADTFSYQKTEVHVKASKSSYQALLINDLKDSFSVATDTSALSSDIGFDARIIVGKE